MNRVLRCAGFTFDTQTPRIMAILNATPDSFSGDGMVGQRDVLLRRAECALKDGAALLDVGGESSRPGALPVSEQEELDRVIPLVEALAGSGAAR